MTEIFFFNVIHEDVTAFLVVNNISDSSKSLYDLISREGFTHILISTSFKIAVGTDLIWLTFSRPSK